MCIVFQLSMYVLKFEKGFATRMVKRSWTDVSLTNKE